MNYRKGVGVQMKITEIPYIIPVNPIDAKIKQSSFEEELKKAMVKTNGTTDNFYILRNSCDNTSIHC